ncbi:hypothetical protein, partial [Gallaecimonas pentaromativorans]|uniref:hypothetical protein n=1 Tax=Gallaecimonas pentaromativorans TaxID=584787 RepID=UPI001E4316E5
FFVVIEQVRLPAPSLDLTLRAIANDVPKCSRHFGPARGTIKRKALVARPGLFVIRATVSLTSAAPFYSGSRHHFRNPASAGFSFLSSSNKFDCQAHPWT